MIEVSGLTKTFDDVVAVDALSFAVKERETLALIGPSGCGKTTTLRMLNRLIEPSSGSVKFQGEDLLSQDPITVRRQIGYVIQGGGLFPHWTTEQNIGLVPRLLGWESDKIEGRVREMLELVQLAPDTFADRFPAEMSGGQQQRVGIARALAASPPIILWDEPFSALDPVTRRELHIEFLELTQQLDTAMVIVTHDMQEAFKLGTRVLVLRDGKMQQLGAPEELRDNPANDFVEGFVRAELS